MHQYQKVLITGNSFFNYLDGENRKTRGNHEIRFYCVVPARRGALKIVSEIDKVKRTAKRV
jgi:uracil phosphoribosyltransferase